MADVTVYGFPISTYVNVVRLALTHKGVPSSSTTSRARWARRAIWRCIPSAACRSSIMRGFRLYETAAIAAYVDEAFTGPALQPTTAQARARMNQWISSLNGYYYPNIAFHLGHERLIYPALGIAPDEKVVAVRCRRSRPDWTSWSASWRRAAASWSTIGRPLPTSSCCRR